MGPMLMANGAVSLLPEHILWRTPIGICIGSYHCNLISA